MIDFHSHILPGVDDGSKNAEMSAALLQMLQQQGVTTVVATPHFYADKDNPQDFLRRRAEGLANLPETPLQVLMGAEVAYFDGMSHSDALRDMCVCNTKLLLVEMPFGVWTDRVVQEVCEIADQGLQPVLAHVDRYRSQFIRFYPRRLEYDVLFQFNADAFLDWRNRRWALAQFDRELVHFIGSDCHNLTTRLPQMDKAAQVITKKRGAEALAALTEFSADMLK